MSNTNTYDDFYNESYENQEWENVGEPVEQPKPKPKFVRPRPTPNIISSSKSNSSNVKKKGPWKPNVSSQTQPQNRDPTNTTTTTTTSQPIQENIASDFSDFFPSNLTQMAAKHAIGTAANQMGFDQNEFLHAAQHISYGWFTFGYYKYYFRVDNEYVIRKLLNILFPFRSRKRSDWKRKMSNTVEYGTQFLTPDKDVNAPDGYLPLMAIVTYVVVMAYAVANSKDDFSPQVLIKTASTSFGLLTIEVLLIKLGFYLIGSVAQPPFWLDVICYSGYKLIFVVINLLVYTLLNDTMYYPVSIITGILASFFMIQTIRPYFKDASEYGFDEEEHTKTKKIFYVALAAAEFLFIQFFGRFTSVK